MCIAKTFDGRVAELVYAADLKSAGHLPVRVRVPPRLLKEILG